MHRGTKYAVQSTLFIPTLDTTTNRYTGNLTTRNFRSRITVILKLWKIKSKYSILQETYVLAIC